MKRIIYTIGAILAIIGIGSATNETQIPQNFKIGVYLMNHEDATPKLIMSDGDIVSFDSKSYTMVLNESAHLNLAKLKVGTRLSLRVDGAIVYDATLWSSKISDSCPDIVWCLSPDPASRKVTVMAGYPTVKWFTGKDLRLSERFLAALKELGKLG